MIRYLYKQKCDECPTCKECNNIGYTDSFVWDKSDIPDDAYDIVKEEESVSSMLSKFK